MEFKIDKKTNKNLNKIAGKFAFQLHKEIVKQVPKRFKNRIVVKQEGKDWLVGTNDEIFKFWEYPTKAHDIKPKFKSSLKFQWTNAPPSIPSMPDGFHYFKKVRHPGTKGKRILEKLTKDKTRLRRLLNKSLK